MTFESFLKIVNEQIERCLFYLKTNKSPGADELNFNVIKHCFGELCGPLITYLIHHYKVKIALLPPVFKTGDTADISNHCVKNVQIRSFFWSEYRKIWTRKTSYLGTLHAVNYLISVPCFSKILECIMYNRLYKYLTGKKVIHPQQFGFRKGSLLYRICNCSACRSDL